VRTELPSGEAVAQDCAARGITGQYSEPIVPSQLEDQAKDFERRRRAPAEYQADVQGQR
jgi:hypothetical protein